MDEKTYSRIAERFSPIIDRITRTMVGIIGPELLKRRARPIPAAIAQHLKEEQRLHSLRESFNAKRQSLEASLITKPWTDEAISRIPDEPLAVYAYGMSQKLQQDFPTIESFCAYWRALHHGSQPARAVPRT